MVGSHYGNNWGGNAISYPLFEDLSRNNQVFSGMFCRFPTSVSLSFGGQTERVSAELVSGTYFPVLGAGAAGFDGGQLEIVPQVFVPTRMKAQMTTLMDAVKARR